MEDRIMTRAFEKKREALDRIAALEKAILDARAEAAKWDGFITMLREVGLPLVSDKPPDDFSKTTVAEAAEIVLQRLGGQAPTKDILNALYDVKRFTGDRQSGYGTLTGTMERHSAVFERVRRGHWRLKNWPTDDGGPTELRRGFA